MQPQRRHREDKKIKKGNDRAEIPARDNGTGIRIRPVITIMSRGQGRLPGTFPEKKFFSYGSTINE